jgi:transposase InsO family protein
VAAGHPGQYKTQELITRNYWWPYIQSDVKKYVSGCETCQRTKAHRRKPENPLHPNEIPPGPWEHISVDLIGELPESQGYNAILVIVDRFSKMIIVIPTNMELTAMGMARMYRDHVWSKHGLPRKIISDRGPQFAAQFMKDLNKLLGITTNLSTAYHPQTDGQTERINQEIEQYLRVFVNYRQTDWFEWLSCAEFSYNDKIQSSTGFSPFYVNSGRHPYKGTNPRWEAKSQSATEFVEGLKKIREEDRSRPQTIQ